MNGNTRNQTWEVTLLTPLHIGDGEELQRNLDYHRDPRGKSLAVININKTLAQLADNPSAVSDLSRGFDLTRFAKDHRIALSTAYHLAFGGSTEPQRMRRQLKDAFGRPYLPGSSLKGAIRTALWTNLDRRSIPPTSADYGKFENAVKRLSGPEPHRDFLRPFQVSDSLSVDAEGILEATEIKFFNIQTGEKAGWKDFSSRRTLDRFEDAAGVYVEAFKTGTRLMVQASIDTFLRTGGHPQQLGNITACQDLANFESLASAMNRHSHRIVESELAFFRRFKNSTAGVTTFYSNLKTAIKSSESKPSHFIVRLAWGSGWRGMTGNWLSNEDIETIRRKKRLGKMGCPYCKNTHVRWDNRLKTLICQDRKCGKTFSNDESWLLPDFPKSRRLAMEGGLPSYPLGWVMVCPVTDSKFRAQPALPIRVCTTEHPAPSAIESSPQGPPVKEVDLDKIRIETIMRFRKNLSACGNLPGEINAFISRVQSQRDPSLKREMGLLLRTRAENLPKKKKLPSALKEGKPWAKDLDKFLHDLGL